ncbi:universal stress protein UspA [Halorientalis sp. IM1011]|uniref:universal stress protein n=1 Tax=Halorientalis sp. IM1011 TaxID=1932360 RepID=UPI00097CD204|nr:universal stress protein [Halorientalis sp. IM1011]AQL41530.1 universal stress protein UspA [Halorientalis sp. IM1011]
MTQVVVPVRYPLTEHSTATLRRAVEIALEEAASLTVLHINLYHNSRRVSRGELKRAVENTFSDLPDVRYVVRTGMLVEETILEEVADSRADIVVIGRKQASRWRRMIRRVTDDPDIERFLQEELDAKIVTV